jgi:type II secretory pathway component GspD/PulD (secretin)
MSKGEIQLSKHIKSFILTLFIIVSVLAIYVTGRGEEILVSDIFHDMFIVDALNNVSVQTGIPIICDSTISGFVTMELNDVPLEEALIRICVPYGYTFRYMEDGYYLVGAADVKNPTFWLLSEVDVVSTKYVPAEVVAKLLSDFYSPYIKVDNESNTLAITASPEIIARINSDIESIDLPVRQVMLEVLVTELSSNARTALGTDWQWNMAEGSGKSTGLLNFTARTLTSSLEYRWPNGIKQFLLSLQVLVEDGEAKIHANPRLVAMNGKNAEIFLGQEQSYMVLVDQDNGTSVSRQRVIIKTGVNLKFLPHISPEGDITVKIEPEVSTITGINPTGFPIISSRKASTTIRVRDGETFVLGGLLQEFETRSVSKVPLFGDIPLLGKLFRSERLDKTETEVIILVTPIIINGEGE